MGQDKRQCLTIVSLYLKFLAISAAHNLGYICVGTVNTLKPNLCKCIVSDNRMILLPFQSLLTFAMQRARERRTERIIRRKIYGGSILPARELNFIAENSNFLHFG